MLVRLTQQYVIPLFPATLHERQLKHRSRLRSNVLYLGVRLQLDTHLPQGTHSPNVIVHSSFWVPAIAAVAPRRMNRTQLVSWK